MLSLNKESNKTIKGKEEHTTENTEGPLQLSLLITIAT